MLKVVSLSLKCGPRDSQYCKPWSDDITRLCLCKTCTGSWIETYRRAGKSQKLFAPSRQAVTAQLLITDDCSKYGNMWNNAQVKQSSFAPVQSEIYDESSFNDPNDQWMHTVTAMVIFMLLLVGYLPNCVWSLSSIYQRSRFPLRQTKSPQAESWSQWKELINSPFHVIRLKRQDARTQIFLRSWEGDADLQSFPFPLLVLSAFTRLLPIENVKLCHTAGFIWLKVC